MLLLCEERIFMKKFNFIGIVAGILSIIFAIIIFGMEVGNSERDIQYGGDAYTGIQNAAAQTARNVVHTNELIRFGFGAVLLVTGLALISLNGVALVNNKEETNTSSLPQTTEIKPVESETKHKNIRSFSKLF